jgi:hypothetical protein
LREDLVARFRFLILGEVVPGNVLQKRPKVARDTTMFALRRTSGYDAERRSSAAKHRDALAKLSEDFENWSLVPPVSLRCFSDDPLRFLKLCMIRHEKR